MYHPIGRSGGGPVLGAAVTLFNTQRTVGMFAPLQHSHPKLSVDTPRIRREESSVKPLHTSEASSIS